MTSEPKEEKEKNQRIGNFEVDVIGEVEIVTEADKINAVKFNIKLDDGTRINDITASLTGPKGLRKLDLYSLHPRIQIFPKISTAQQRFTNLVRVGLSSAAKETQYRVSRLGTSIIDGTPIFNTGGGLIGPPSDIESKTDIVFEPSKYKPDTDPSLSEAETVAEMIKIVRLSPDAGRVILAHSLLYMMRKAYEAAWKSLCCILFLSAILAPRKRL